MQQRILHILREVALKNFDFLMSCMWQNIFQENSFGDRKVGFFCLAGFSMNIIRHPICIFSIALLVMTEPIEKLKQDYLVSIRRQWHEIVGALFFTIEVI